jgi:predicted ATPase/DNA-binding XRE family transcriptional regulator
MEAAGRSDFGTLLRQLRVDAAMTQQELAERAKLSVEAISQLERGARTRPQRETLALLARALDLSPERQSLLIRAAQTAPRGRPRERSDRSDLSLLRLVRSDIQTAANHNLPRQLTSFLGREREVSEIAALLQEHRLVTVVGAGGVGKTRVAVQLGTDVLDGYSDGAWLIDLAPLAHQDLVENAILSALQLPSSTGSALDVIIAYLRGRRLLLLLDNCEHVITRTRDVAEKVMEACLSVRILATSREALGAAGEHVYRLPSLAVPPDPLVPTRDALHYGAVKLLVDRALEANPGFTLSDDNVRDLVEICRRLDGIPLAIELAAARTNVITPRQIAQRLDQRFRLLAGSRPGALPRHQTMTALIDWSYDFLTSREQRFFEALSVFMGGCTLEAATEVCAEGGEDDVDVIDLITSLVTKSLLVAELVSGEQRYRLLESSRQYARDKLASRNGQHEVERCHAVTYVELAERLEAAWSTTPELEWLPHAQAEVENWRAALEWTLGKRHEVALGQRFASLRYVLSRSLPLPEARRWLHIALESVDQLTSPALVASLEHADAETCALAAGVEATLAAAQRALAWYRQVDDVLGTAQAQSLAAHALTILERLTEAEPLLHQALGIAQTLEDRRLAAKLLRTKAFIKCRRGDFTGARACYTEALQLAKTAGAEFLAATIAANLADNEADAGDPETALHLMTDVVAKLREMHYSEIPKLTTTIAEMSRYLIMLGRYDEAGAHASEALQLARELRIGVSVAFSLQFLALVAVLDRQSKGRRTSLDCAGAARLLGFAAVRLAELGIPEFYGVPQERDRAIALLGDAIGADEVTRLMTSGAAMTEDEAVAQARALGLT